VRAAIQKADATVDEHVLVAASGEDRDGAVFGSARVPADERDQAPQLSSRRREAGRRQRVSRRKVSSSGRTDAGAGGSVPVEGGRQQAAVEVNVAGVSSGVAGKRVDRSKSDGLGNARAGWEIVPPRDRLEKRSAADRVAALSNNAKRWVGMVRKGRKRAAAPVNSQKKKMKKSYVDCWDFLDTVGSSVLVQDEARSASAAERDRVFLEESGFP
jgi:hypothetical protein